EAPVEAVTATEATAPVEPPAEAAEEVEAAAIEQEAASSEPISPVAEPEVSGEAAEESSTGEQEVEAFTFTEQEWEIFRQLMSSFTKPVSFAHIFDSLRTLRQQEKLARTNEQLRTLVKQAINKGMLERSGRGTRVYYRLAGE